MKVTLVRKNDKSDIDPLIVMVEHPEDLIRDDKKSPGKHGKIIVKVQVGECIDAAKLHPLFEEEGKKFSDKYASILGAHIMAAYPGCFEHGEIPVEPKFKKPSMKSLSEMKSSSE